MVPAALVVSLAAARAAAAKAPPRGEYECTIGGNLFGNVTITGSTTSTRFGKRGKFIAKGTFPSRMRDWRRTTDGVDEIALRNPRDNFESIYCGT